MAKYDYGGGCACGLQRVCDCKHNAQSDGSKPSDPKWQEKVSTAEASLTRYDPAPHDLIAKKVTINYKYKEPEILKDLADYLDKTYGQHYNRGDDNIQAFDAWLTRPGATDTFINTALKYLWRYGAKNGNNKDDLMKAAHYVFMALYSDHYRGK